MTECFGPDAVRQALNGGCVLDEARGLDPETKEYVYSVICVAEAHKNIPTCPTEHEMFRIPGDRIERKMTTVDFST